MKKQWMKKKVLVCLCTAALLSVSVFGLQARAYFRKVQVLAKSEKTAAAVGFDKRAGSTYGICPSLDTHFGDWTVGDVFKAEFHVRSTGNIDVVPAPQLDIIGTDGTSYNTCFEGTYTVSGTGAQEADIPWADEQKSSLVIPAGEQEITVSYVLSVKTALPNGVQPVPEFSCALIQAKNQQDEFKASARKIASSGQTGFSASIGKDDVKDAAGNKLTETYGMASYTSKTFKLTVTPDDADTATTVNIYKLDDTTDTTAFLTETKLVTASKTATEKTYSLSFAARKGMNCIIVVDAENEKAGHKVYKYAITWPADGSLGWTRTELDKTGFALN